MAVYLKAATPHHASALRSSVIRQVFDYFSRQPSMQTKASSTYT
jgi:hypothetical protein